MSRRDLGNTSSWRSGYRAPGEVPSRASRPPWDGEDQAAGPQGGRTSQAPAGTPRPNAAWPGTAAPNTAPYPAPTPFDNPDDPDEGFGSPDGADGTYGGAYDEAYHGTYPPDADDWGVYAQRGYASPAPPGPDYQPGDLDDSFEAVTYDRTAYPDEGADAGEEPGPDGDDDAYEDDLYLNLDSEPGQQDPARNSPLAATGFLSGRQAGGGAAAPPQPRSAAAAPPLPGAGYQPWQAGSSQPGGDWPAESWPAENRPEEDWPQENWQPRDPGRRPPARQRGTGARPPIWILAGVTALAAAITGAGIVMLSNNHPASSRSAGHTVPPAFSAAAPSAAAEGAAASRAPAAEGTGSGAAPGSTSPAASPSARGSAQAAQAPLTLAAAQQVVSSYTATNNTANHEMSASLLATVETGSSRALDAGIYRERLARKIGGYPAFVPQQASYYIPLEQPGTYPHWFAVQVTDVLEASPHQVIGTGYMVFTQAAQGAPWKNAVEPFLVKGTAAPKIALDASGFATAVSPQAAGLALTPASASEATAAALNSGNGAVSVHGDLADKVDQAFWRKELGASATDTDQHSATANQVFALRTTDGGALLFYDVAAELTLARPHGQTMRITVSGFYSANEAVTTAGLAYLDQFATYDPPASAAAGGTGTGNTAQSGGSRPTVVAGYSGITARN